jgi:hypothetical protein
VSIVMPLAQRGGVCGETCLSRWSVLNIGCVASKALALALALVVLIGIPPAGAQVTTGNVTGSVRDAQGAVVPSASVTLVSGTRGTTIEVRGAGSIAMSAKLHPRRRPLRGWTSSGRT